MQKRISLIYIAIIFLQCHYVFAQESVIYIENDKMYGELKDGLPEKDTIVELKKDGILIGKGSLAIGEYGVSNLRVGYWKEYYENGNLKMEGNYKIGSYISCCVGGACRSFHYYRSGLWKIYDNGGNLKYELIFEPTKLHIDTTCEGGDKLLFGIIKKIPLKYWGDLTSDKIFELQQIHTENEYDFITWTPLNGRLFIEFKVKKAQ